MVYFPTGQIILPILNYYEEKICYAYDIKGPLTKPIIPTGKWRLVKNKKNTIKLQIQIKHLIFWKIWVSEDQIMYHIPNKVFYEHICTR
jgi:hypothetical protein